MPTRTPGRTLPAILRTYAQDTEGYYGALRRSGGVDGALWDEELQAWVVTGYALCRELLGSSLLTKSRLHFEGAGILPGLEAATQRAQAVASRQMIFDESAAADRAHRLWWQTLRVRNDPAFGHFLAENADAIWRSQGQGNHGDFYNQGLRPYVSRAVAGKLGLSESERQALYPLIYAYADFIDGKMTEGSSVGNAIVSVALLADFVDARFDRLRRCSSMPIEDRNRWVADYILTLVAGHESTAYALAVCLNEAARNTAVLQSPDALRRLLLEALRFDSPIQLIGRVARADIALPCDITIGSGDKVFLHVGAANRDPRQFPDPDRFVMDRRQTELLSFGWGASRCIGMSLALLQARIFLEAGGRILSGQRVAIDGMTFAHRLAGRSIDKMKLRTCPVVAGSCAGGAANGGSA